MALLQYGVLAGRAIGVAREDGAETPHYELRVASAGGEPWPVAINVLSRQPPSELLYLVEADFRHPITARLSELAPGWHVLEPRAGGANLDYIRANLLERDRMRVLPPAVEGPDNDLADLLDHWLGRAVAEPQATVYAYGERFGRVVDGVFRPATGVHDVHMNQGSTAEFKRSNGVWQDGGLVVRFPRDERWVAIFLAFQSQSWHTDDVTGHALDAGDAAGRVQIVAAVVRPSGDAPGSVLLLNVAPAPVALDGWHVVDDAKRRHEVPARRLASGETVRVRLARDAALPRAGGAITLLDAAGLKVDGVAYTAADATPVGWNVTF